jgi:hypothetical protein
LGKEMLKNSFGDHVARRRRRAFLKDVWIECVDEKISSAHCRPAWVKLSRYSINLIEW